MTIIDLSYPVRNAMPVFPGDPDVCISSVCNIASDGFNLSQISFGAHAGTHIDLPKHIINTPLSVCDYDAKLFCGRGSIINSIGNPVTSYRVDYECIVKNGDCVLVVTSFCDMYKEPDRYFNEYPTIDMSFAKFLVRKKVKLLALDTPSPDVMPYDIHKYLLGEGVFIAENLRGMEALRGKRFNFFCPPVGLDTEAAPCRAFAVLLDGIQ